MVTFDSFSRQRLHRVEQTLPKAFSFKDNPILIPAREQMNCFQMEICYVKVGIVCGRTIHDACCPGVQLNNIYGRIRIEVECEFVGVQYFYIGASQPPQR